jgi:hypothetical protein
MEVVGKNGVGEDIDPEDGGEFLDPLSDPFFSVGEVFSGDIIEPAEVSASDASLNDVEDRNLQWGKNLTSFRSRHSKFPQKRTITNCHHHGNRCQAPVDA